jgi:hypothetical protein
MSVGANRHTLRYTGWSFGPVALVATLLAWMFGGLGLLIAGVTALPWLAWRYDNQTGAFLPLAVLLLLVVAVLGLLLFLTVLVFFAGH